MWMLPVFRCYSCMWQWATLMQITSLGDVEHIWDSIKVPVSCKLSPLCPQGGIGHTFGEHSAQSSKIAHFKHSIKIFICKYYNHILNVCQVSWQWNFFLLILKYLYNHMNTVSKYNDNKMTHLLEYHSFHKLYCNQFKYSWLRCSQGIAEPDLQ